MTTLITEAVGLTQMFWLLRRNVSLGSTALLVLRVAIPAAAMGLMVWALKGRMHPAGIIAVAAILYGAAVTGMRIVPLGEVKAIFSRRGTTGEPVDEQSPASNP